MSLKELRIILFSGFILLNVIGCKRDSPSEEHVPAVFIHETEEGYQLMRNGNPFYIKGAAAHPEYLEELQAAGANAARIYDTINLLETLNKAEELGLAVVVDIPLPQFHTDPEYYEDPVLFNKMRDKIAKVIRRHRNHPALLYWNLGNELYYPYFYRTTDFYDNYNSLIDLIHETDPNHPVSTTTIGANKLMVVSILMRSPQLDFISFNSFGTLSSFSDRLDPIVPIWDGPHVIAEWGVNGPWEATETKWGAPIEETSTKEAEQIRQRYERFIKPLKEKNSFGSFVFYWGSKNEVTPTWFSLFGKEHLKSQAVFELTNIWNDTNTSYPGPQLDYMLLNRMGAADNIILPPGSEAFAEVKIGAGGNLSYNWELRHESWHERLISSTVEEEDFSKNGNQLKFTTPKEEGPYRLFVYLTDESEYFATANIPFYVLDPGNEDKF